MDLGLYLHSIYNWLTKIIPSLQHITEDKLYTKMGTKNLLNVIINAFDRTYLHILAAYQDKDDHNSPHGLWLKDGLCSSLTYSGDTYNIITLKTI